MSYSSSNYVIKLTIVLVIDHFSTSVAISKFHGNQQIPRLGSKFRGTQKTVGPNYQ